MKYSRLTKEQFEELHKEFARFLAGQSITADEWETLKKEKPQVAEDELDVFSDLIWEGTLANVSYLENRSNNHVYLFHFKAETIQVIIVKAANPEIDLTSQEGIGWLEKNIVSDEVELYEGTKAYTLEKNLEIFNYIKEGAVITKGGFYNILQKLLS